MEEQKVKEASNSTRKKVLLIATGLLVGFLLGTVLIHIWQNPTLWKRSAPQEINKQEIDSFRLEQLSEGRTIGTVQLFKRSVDIRFQEVLDALAELECEKSELALDEAHYQLELYDASGKVLYCIGFRKGLISVNGETYELEISENYGKLMYLFGEILRYREYPGATLAQAVEEEPDELEDVTLEMSYLTYEGALILLQNHYQSEYTYGMGFLVEAYKDGTWYKVKNLPNNVAFNLLEYTLDAGEQTYLFVNWADFYGVLPAGRYRVRTDVTNAKSTETYDIAVEFSLPESGESVLLR